MVNKTNGQLGERVLASGYLQHHLIPADSSKALFLIYFASSKEYKQLLGENLEVGCK